MAKPPTTVCCANEVAKKVANQVEGTVALPYECGCEVTSQLEIPTRTLIGIGRNPNVAAVLLVSLGCETMDCEYVASEICKSKKPVELIVIQELGGTINATEKGVRIAQKMVQDASQIEMKSYDLSALVVATKCGGSDLTSGIAANPAAGVVSDMIGGGAQVILFTTGRGSPVGAPIAPVIKITGNPYTYEKMKDNIDINAGTIIEGK